jgi:hypothetical protein
MYFVCKIIGSSAEYLTYGYQLTKTFDIAES